MWCSCSVLDQATVSSYSENLPGHFINELLGLLQELARPETTTGVERRPMLREKWRTWWYSNSESLHVCSHKWFIYINYLHKFLYLPVTVFFSVQLCSSVSLCTGHLYWYLCTEFSWKCNIEQVQVSLTCWGEEEIFNGSLSNWKKLVFPVTISCVQSCFIVSLWTGQRWW